MSRIAVQNGNCIRTETNMGNKTFHLTELAKKQIIICAHRGAWGGNIPCNTLTAYEIALSHGADMIELDVTASADGELFVFHPGQEERQLNLKNTDIRKMEASEIRKLRYANLDGAATEEPIYLLDDVLEHLKGRCFINVDKFADNPARIIEKIKKHNMAEQIVLKSNAKPDVLKVIQTYAPDLQYLAIISGKPETHEMLMQAGINYVGLEVVFADDSSTIASREFFDRVHSDGKLIWGNSILFNYRKKLAGAHSDDTALRGDPDLGWGYFAKNGFDIIQTDWPLALSRYLEETGQRLR